MSVRLFIWNNSASTRRIFMKSDIWEFFEKLSIENSRFIKIWHEKLALYMKANIHFWSYHSHFILERSFTKKKKSYRKSKHAFKFNKHIFVNRTAFETTWKNTVEPGRPQMKIRRMRISYWVPKCYKHTLSEYVILIVFYYNSVCMNATQCYVIRTLPALLNFFIDANNKYTTKWINFIYSNKIPVESEKINA
jgi:hypothetical protein